MMYGGSQMDSFTQSQSTQGSDPAHASAKRRDNPPLLPLTVKQISQAVTSSDDKSTLVIDGIDVRNVRLVGMAFKKLERATDVTFAVDDGTGRMEGTRWVNNPVETKEVEEVLDGMYVRVHGGLKISQGKMQLVIFAIRPITDYNEIASHFLECIYVHQCNRKLQSGLSVSTPGQAHAPAAVNNSSSGYNSKQLSENLSLDKFTSIENMVMAYLDQPSSRALDQGIHRNEIAEQLNLSREKILDAMNTLVIEGRIYSTIDDFHYKSAEN